MTSIPVCFFVCARDAEATLPAVLGRLEFERASGAALLVIDHASRDGTSRVAREHNVPFVYEPGRSLGAALRRGVAWLRDELPRRGSEDAIVVVLRGTHDSEVLRALRLADRLSREGTEIVLADRGAIEAGASAARRAERLAETLAAAWIERTTGVRLGAMALPLVARLGTLSALLERPGIEAGDTTVLALEAIRSGLRVSTVPIAAEHATRVPRPENGTTWRAITTGVGTLRQLCRHAIVTGVWPQRSPPRSIATPIQETRPPA